MITSGCAASVCEQLEQNIQSIPDDSNTGYILNLDMEYPKELHDSHSNFPLAPTQQEFSFEQLSPYSQNSLKNLRGVQTTKRYKSKKLSSTFLRRKRYTTHYRNVKTYMRLGMQVKKVHHAFKFRQAPIGWHLCRGANV